MAKRLTVAQLAERLACALCNLDERLEKIETKVGDLGVRTDNLEEQIQYIPEDPNDPIQ